MRKILVVEDNLALCDLLSMYLENSGFLVEISNTINSTLLLELKQFSIVLLDINLPDGNGKSLISNFFDLKIPVIILTANNSLTEKVKGLNLGADDYISKPFESLELIARIRALLRRTKEVEENISIDEARIYINEKKAILNDKELSLTLKEWELLLYLIRNRGQLLSRVQILNFIWGYDYYGETRTVDVHIQQLRKKLNIKSIKTIYKQGYRLEI